MSGTRSVLNRGVSALGPSVDQACPRWRARLTRGFTVFMFHEVTDAPSPFHRQHGSYLTEDGFRKRLEWISRRFTVVTPPSDPLTPDREKLLNDVAAQTGLVLRNVRLIEELRESRRRIVDPAHWL